MAFCHSKSKLVPLNCVKINHVFVIILQKAGHHIRASFARTSCIFVMAVVSLEVSLEHVDGHDVVAGTAAS